MNIPEEYLENLRDGIVSEEMMEDALQAVNKRAMAIRIKRLASDDSNDISLIQQENELFAKKDKLLSYLQPISVHKTFNYEHPIRVYKNDPEFDKAFFEHILSGDFIDVNMDYIDYPDPDYPEYQYYLYYMCGGSRFHKPIEQKDADRKLYTLFIRPFKTRIVEEEDLLPESFADDVIIALANGAKYTGIMSEEDLFEIQENEYDYRDDTPKDIRVRRAEEYVEDYEYRLKDILADAINTKYSDCFENPSDSVPDQKEIDAAKNTEWFKDWSNRFAKDITGRLMQSRNALLKSAPTCKPGKFKNKVQKVLNRDFFDIQEPSVEEVLDEWTFEYDLGEKTTLDDYAARIAAMYEEDGLKDAWSFYYAQKQFYEEHIDDWKTKHFYNVLKKYIQET